MACPLKGWLAQRLWNGLRNDRVIMLGLAEAGADQASPVAIHAEEVGGPLHLFAIEEDQIARLRAAPLRAVATYASFGNDLFATLQGWLTIETDCALVARLLGATGAQQSRVGHLGPVLQIVRLDVDRARVWTSPPKEYESASEYVARVPAAIVLSGVHVK